MATLNPLEFYLNVLRPTTVFTGMVSDSLVDPYMEIYWDGGATGTPSTYATSGAPIPGNTVWLGTTEGGKERGEVRLRYWSPAGGNPATGVLSIAETADVGPMVEDDDYITIKQDFRMWPIYPFYVRDGENVTAYQDYDLTYASQGEPTNNWKPHAVAPPPDVVFLDGGIATSYFVGDRSFAFDSATITDYLWTAHGSNELTSTSQGTTASPVAFTYNQEGQYLVSLKITDSNGQTHTAYTWVFVNDPNGTQIAYTDIDSASDNFDFSQGGGDLSFTVHGNGDVGQFPEGSMVVYSARGTMIDSDIGSWPYRETVLFVGYIASGSINQSPDNNSLSVKAVSLNSIGGVTSIFILDLKDSNSPSIWDEAKDITVDKMCSFMSHWYSTLANIAPIRPLNYAAEIFWIVLGTSSVWGEMNNVLDHAWAKNIVNHQGIVHWERDYQMMTTGSERAATPEGRELTNTDWIGDIVIEERSIYARTTSKVSLSGVYYPGDLEASEPYFSAAPGEDIPKAFGSYTSKDGLILTTQDDLNRRSGLALAKDNMKYPIVRAKFFNNAGFTNAPQTRYTAIINPDDNNRGLSWNPILIPRRIRRSYDHKAGYFTVDVEFEPDASGPPGVTVTKPSEPPVPAEGDTPVIPSGVMVDLLSASSVYLLFGTDWQAYITGTTTLWAEGDPWVANSTILRGEVGGLYKSTNYGLAWTDVSPDTTPSGTAAIANISFMDIQPDTFRQSFFVAGGTYFNASNKWESYIGYTSGSGDAWGWW